MTINIQYVHMPTSESLDKIVSGNLEKLANKYSDLINADVFFKKESDPKGKGKVCEMQLSLPGPRIFAKSDEDDFEKAAAETISDLESQLRKRKEKSIKQRRTTYDE